MAGKSAHNPTAKMKKAMKTVRSSTKIVLSTTAVPNMSDREVVRVVKLLRHWVAVHKEHGGGIVTEETLNKREGPTFDDEGMRMKLHDDGIDHTEAFVKFLGTDLPDMIQDYERGGHRLEEDLAQLSPLEKAVLRGQTSKVKSLLQGRADPNATPEARICLNFGRAPALVYACFPLLGERYHVAKALLEHKADLHQRDELGTSALGYASYFGEIELIKLFLLKGANADNDSFSALGQAVSQRHFDCVEILLHHMSAFAVPKASLDGRLMCPFDKLVEMAVDLSHHPSHTTDELVQSLERCLDQLVTVDDMRWSPEVELCFKKGMLQRIAEDDHDSTDMALQAVENPQTLGRLIKHPALQQVLKAKVMNAGTLMRYPLVNTLIQMFVWYPTVADFWEEHLCNHVSLARAPIQRS